MFNEDFGRNDGYEGDERLEIVDLNTNDATPQDHLNKERLD
jgi:hypothetical protein